jgi:predicted transcriptional regulator
MTTTTQGVKLNETTSQRLKALGKLKKRSPHFLMKTAIENYIEREENYEKEKLEDAQRWERYELTGEAVSHDAASQWLTDLAQGKAASCPK